MRERGEQISPIDEVFRNTKVERGAPEQQISVYQPVNNNNRKVYCPKCH